MSNEIERKWKYEIYNESFRRRVYYQIKDTSKIKKESILNQIYITHAPFEIRVRSTKIGNDTTYKLAIKIGKGLKRKEYEKKIGKFLARILWKFQFGGVISKRRITFEDDLVVDLFFDFHLLVIEKEFESMEEASAYKLNVSHFDAFFTDVTGDEEFRVKMLKLVKKQRLTWEQLNNNPF